MNEEKDPLLSRLTKAAGNPRAPKLDETILTQVSQGDSAKSTKLSLAERFRAASRRLQLGSLAAAGALGILAVALAVPQQAGLRISLGGSSSSGPASSETTNKMVAGGSMTSDMMVAIPALKFVASPELENTAGSGDVYQIVAKLSGNDLASNVANFFGLNGTAKKETAPVIDGAVSASSNNWTLTDGSESIYVYDYGLSSFNYYNSDAYVNGECLETEKINGPVQYDDGTKGNVGTGDSSASSSGSSPVAPDEMCVKYAQVEANLPSKQTAITEALRIFNHFGYGISVSDLYVEAGQDFINITTYPKVNGISVPIWSSVNWGNTGKLASVNGVSIDLVKAGTVDTIGARDSVARTGQWVYGVTAAEPIDASVFDGNVYWRTPLSEKVIEVEITSARETLGLLYDTKGGAWLVPSYKLFGDKGLAATVIAVVDGVLDLPKDTGVMPMVK